jgi:hypothetical protein
MQPAPGRSRSLANETLPQAPSRASPSPHLAPEGRGTFFSPHRTATTAQNPAQNPGQHASSQRPG